MRTVLLSLLFLWTSNFLFGQSYPPGGTFPWEAPIINCVLPGYISITGPIVSPYGSPAFCGSPENQQFLAFVAEGETVQLQIDPLVCQGTPNGAGIQAHIYEMAGGCSGSPNSLVAVSNCESPAIEIPLFLTASGLQCGEIYYLMIDGWAGDICEYTISYFEFFNLFPDPGPPSLNGPSAVLAGATANYSVDFDQSCPLNNPCNLVFDPVCLGTCWISPSDVTWTVSAPDAVIIGNGFDATVIWGNTSGTVCVTIENDCYFWQECLFVEVTPPIQTIIQETICLGESYPFCGNILTLPGTYECVETAQSGVDSVIILLLTMDFPQLLVEEIQLCNEECAFLVPVNTTNCDSALVESINESFVDSNGCTGTYIAIIERYFFEMDLPATDTLWASEGSVEIAPLNVSYQGPQPATYAWYGPGLDPMNPPADSILTVTQPGWYYFSLDSIPCSAIDSMEVIYVNDECAFNDPISLGETCETAPLFCGNVLEGYCSSNAGASGEAQGNLDQTVNCPIENNVWLELVPCDTLIQFTFEAYNCNQNEGIEIALLSTSDCQQFSAQDTLCYAIGNNGSEVFSFGGLVPGASYYLMLDGINGDVCEFSFSDMLGLAGGEEVFLNYSPILPGTLSGPTEVCLRDTAIFTFNGPEGVLLLDSVAGNCAAIYQQLCGSPTGQPEWGYEASYDTIWTLSAGMEFIGDSTGSSIQVAFNDTIPGPIQVELVLLVDSLFLNDPCWTTCGPVSLTNQVVGSWTISPDIQYFIYTPQPLLICEGESAIFCNDTIFETGIYICPDSCGWQVQEVIVQTISQVDEGTVTLCEGECYEWYGETLCEPGTYTYLQPDFCVEYLVELQILTTDTTNLGLIELCENECFAFQGVDYCDPGEYFLVDDSGNCESYTFFTLNVLDPDTTDLGLIQLCQGECFQYAGLNYCDTDSYVVEESDSCLHYTTFSLEVLPTDTTDLGLVEVCAGTCYSILDTTLCDAGDYVLPDASGNCLAVTLVSLVVLAPDTVDLGVIELCENECYSFGGTDYCQAGDYSIAQNDSCLVYSVFTIQVIPTQVTDLGLIEVCAGQCFEYAGESYCQTGSYEIDVPDPCPNITTWDLVVLPPDTTDLGTQVVCLGECFSLDAVQYCDAGDYAITNTDSCTQVYLFTLEVVPVDTIDLGVIELCVGECFTLDGVDYCTLGNYEAEVVGPDGCLDFYQFSVVVLPPTSVLIGPVVELCDATYTSYTVSFQINSDYAPFSVNGQVLAGNQFNSAPIPSGSSYAFSVSDANSCGTPVAVVGTYFCPTLCMTEAGTMSPTPLETCTLEAAVAEYLGGAMLEGDDTFEFVLHTSSEDTLGTILDRNTFGIFTFDPDLMDLGITYYVSAVAGDALNGQVDLEDACLSVSPGQPVVFYADPMVQVNPPNVLTCDQQAVQLEALASGGEGDLVIEWYDENGNLIGTGNTKWVNEEGGYSALVTDQTTGCQASTFIQVVEDTEAPNFSFIQAPIVCGATTSELSINPYDPSWEVTWTYPNGVQVQNVSSIIASESGIYSVLAEGENGCTHYIALNIVPFYLPVQAAITTKSPTCSYKKNGAILIDTIYGGIPPYSVFLDGESANQELLENVEAGVYYLEIMDAGVCVLDTLVEIAPSEELWVEADPLYQAVRGEVIEIALEGSFEPTKVEWKIGSEIVYETPGFSLPLQAVESAEYRVKAFHENGCVAKTEFALEVAFGRDIYVPNVFTPNGDGQNDYFTLYGAVEVQEIRTFEVFSRWGDLVFAQRSVTPGAPSAGWDGRKNGQLLPEGTYVYLMEVVLKDGSTQLITGDVLLIY